MDPRSQRLVNIAKTDQYVTSLIKFVFVPLKLKENSFSGRSAKHKAEPL